MLCAAGEMCEAYSIDHAFHRGGKMELNLVLWSASVLALAAVLVFLDTTMM